jgi:hypothetical protein
VYPASRPGVHTLHRQRDAHQRAAHVPGRHHVTNRILLLPRDARHAAEHRELKAPRPPVRLHALRCGQQGVQPVARRVLGLLRLLGVVALWGRGLLAGLLGPRSICASSMARPAALGFATASSSVSGPPSSGPSRPSPLAESIVNYLTNHSG